MEVCIINTVRVTLTFPEDFWEEVKRTIPSGERSGVIVEATRREIQRRKQFGSIKRIQALQDRLKGKYGEMPSCVEDIQQMREERDAEVNNLP